MPKKQVCEYNHNKICLRCFRRLSAQNSGIPMSESNNKLSFIDKLIKKYAHKNKNGK